MDSESEVLEREIDEISEMKYEIKDEIKQIGDCFNVSPNLYNIYAACVLNGAYLNASNGVSIISDLSTSNWRTSDFIDVSNGNKVYFYRLSSTGKIVTLNTKIYWYDSNKEFIICIPQYTSNNIERPINAKYIRIAEEISIQYGYKCSVSIIDVTSIDDYGKIYSLKEDYYEKGSNDNYDDMIEKITKKMELYSPLNLYNPNDITWKNGYIDANGGSGTGDYKHKTFDVSEGDIFAGYITDNNGNLSNETRTTIRFVCAFDSDGTIIYNSGLQEPSTNYIVPSGITKITISVLTKYITCLTKNKNLNGHPYIPPSNDEYYKATPEFLSGVFLELPKSASTFIYGSSELSGKLELMNDGDTINLGENSCKKSKYLVFYADIITFSKIFIGHGMNHIKAIIY